MLSRRDGALLLVTALPRLAYLLIARPAFAGPYWLLADELVTRGSFGVPSLNSTEFEPIYPVFLAAARLLARDRIVGVQILQIAVSSIGAILLYRLAHALTGRERVAWIAALLYAGDLLLIRQSVGQGPSVVVTTLLIAFTYAFVAATTTGKAAGAGLLLGLLVLARTMALPLAACATVIFMVKARPRAALALALAALLLVVPWSIRSYRVNGSWWPTRSGLNLFISSLPVASTLVPDYDVDLLVPLVDPILAEELRDPNNESPASLREVDRILTWHAIANVSADPMRAVEGRIRNLAHYFWPPLVPHYVQGPATRIVVSPNGGVVVLNAVARPRSEIVAYSVLYTIVLVAAMAGAFIRRHRLLDVDAMLMCIVATFAATHAIYFPATRYRAPVMFVALFYAAVTFDRLAGALVNRRRSASVAAPTPA